MIKRQMYGRAGFDTPQTSLVGQLTDDPVTSRLNRLAEVSGNPAGGVEAHGQRAHQRGYVKTVNTAADPAPPAGAR
jgi:hypothetical protein